MATKTSPIKLESNRGARFHNVMHAKFHQTQYDLIAKTDLAKINVTPDMLKEWKDAIEVEVEINKQAQASVTTNEMLAKDRERDEALINLFGIIRAQLYSHVEVVRKAAAKLAVELKPYFGIRKEINENETGLIRGLVFMPSLSDGRRTDTGSVPTCGLTAELASIGLMECLRM